MGDKQDSEPGTEVDPKEFLAALLKISPEDAADVREIADVKAEPDAKRSSD